MPRINRLAIAAVLLLPTAAAAQNFGNIPPGSVLGNPTTATAPARPFVPSGMGASPSQWGGKANDATFDSAAALNAALAGSTVPIVIGSTETFYAGATIAVPDKAVLRCEPGGTIKRHSSMTATDSRPLVSQASTVGSSIEGCTIDLNSPASGNWLSGLASVGSTANVRNRDLTIVNASASGLDWYFADQNLTHTNDRFDNIRIIGSGRYGAVFERMIGGYAADVSVISSGADGIVVGYGSVDFNLVRAYVTKATPPPLLYSGLSAETGMCIFRGYNTRLRIDRPTCNDNRNAASDGLGIGENGIPSTTSATPPTAATPAAPVSMTFATIGNMVAGPGYPFTAVSMGNPFTVRLDGVVTTVATNSVTASITSAKGAGAHTDWILTSEPGEVTIVDPIVYRAGLFGIDLDSNTHVIGGVVEEAAHRGLMIGRDLGGLIRNASVSGLTIKSTGLAGDPEPSGIVWGTTNPGLMVSIENVTVTGSPVVDTRVTPLTQLGQNVDLDHGRYRNVFYDAGSVAAAPFGTVKSYNTFGSTTPDPHLDGSPTPFTLGVAFGGASVGATYDAVNNQGVYTVRGNTVSVAANLILTAKGSSTGSATLTGLPFVSGTNAAAGQFSCTSYGNMAGLTGAPAGLVPANATTVTLGQGGAAATSFLSDANFTNTTNLRCAGFYFR